MLFHCLLSIFLYFHFIVFLFNKTASISASAAAVVFVQYCEATNNVLKNLKYTYKLYVENNGNKELMKMFHSHTNNSVVEVNEQA